MLCALACSSRTPERAESALPVRAEDALPDALAGGDPDEPIALAFFLRSDAGSELPERLRALDLELPLRGGERIYAGSIDPALAGPALPYDVLVIDRYATRRAGAQLLHELAPTRARLEREQAFVLVLRPWGSGMRLVSNALASIFGTLLAREIRAVPPLVETPEEVHGSREISPDPQALRRFEESDPDASVAMLNLNQFRAQARYALDGDREPAVSGEVAYWRYARVAVPQVMRRGGRLIFAGQPIGRPIGAAGPLDRRWDQLALVYYPSLRALEDMVADPEYRAGAVHRVAALAHATLLATTPWQDFDPVPTAR